MKRILALCIVFMMVGSLAWGGVVIKGAKIGVYANDYTNDSRCVGAWYMNIDGNETDRTVNGNTLTETSGTIPTTLFTPIWYVGKSRDFEATDTEYLLGADETSLDINGVDAKLTIACWIKCESTVDATAQYIITKWVTADTSRQYRLYITGNGTTKFSVGFVASSNGVATTTATTLSNDYNIGTWYHLAVVSNDIDIRIYVNGELANNPISHTGGYFDGDQPFVIGASGSGGTVYDGLVDDVAVFNDSLSNNEIVILKNNGVCGERGARD